MPEEMPWADPVVVPDDIRALQPDIDAYHREQRLARRRDRRRDRRQRLTHSRLWRRWSFPLGVLTGALALAAIVFAVLAVDGAGQGVHRGPVPLAHPAAEAGSVGGLLPDVTLTRDDGSQLAARSLRPALVVLLPAHCRCTPLLDSLAAQAAEVAVPLVVIGPVVPDAEVAALPGQLHRGRVVTAYDPAGALAAAYDAHQVAALVVGRDGLVSYVNTDLTPAMRLELPLQAALLIGPGAHS